MTSISQVSSLVMMFIDRKRLLPNYSSRCISQQHIFKRIFSGFRTVELSIIFLPILILYPIRNVTLVSGWYNDLLKRSLMNAGPVFIKLGQWMSTRRDLFDGKLLNTLSTLTTDAKTHSFIDSKRQISGLIDLKEFKYIDPEPIGIFYF